MWRLSLLLVGARAATITWREPMPASEQSLTVSGDERITFAWTGNHNVRLLNTKEEYDACDLDDALEVGDEDVSPYTIEKASYLAEGVGSESGWGYDTPIYFVCSVGNHCRNNQKITITVTRAEDGDHDGHDHGDESEDADEHEDHGDEHEDHGDESEDADEHAGHDHGDEDEDMEESDGAASIAPALGAAGTVVVLAALSL